jgi:hypothetical protein
LRVEEIVADAHARGEGFVPECNDVIGVIVNPIDETNATIAQITVIEVPLLCEPIYVRETAWGRGSVRFKTGWGSYGSFCP